MKRTLTTALAAMMLCIPAIAETSETVSEEKDTKKEKKEVKYNEKGEIIKTGTNFGPLPVVAFDADRGFQFGALMNIYNFGDGKNYPNPNAQWYFEGSAYVKEGNVGSYLFRAEYDNKTLIPGVRMSVCAGYYKDAALDFYGFNGYQSNYDMDLIKSNILFSDDKAGEKLANKFEKKGIEQIVLNLFYTLRYLHINTKRLLKNLYPFS